VFNAVVVVASFVIGVGSKVVPPPSSGRGDIVHGDLAW
jgi:hypothetical protein